MMHSKNGIHKTVNIFSQHDASDTKNVSDYILPDDNTKRQTRLISCSPFGYKPASISVQCDCGMIWHCNVTSPWNFFRGRNPSTWEMAFRGLPCLPQTVNG
jgi:hypothetical protein